MARSSSGSIGKSESPAGDSALIGAELGHASFNVSDRQAKPLAILGPCVGPEGYELVDVAGQEPWAPLR